MYQFFVDSSQISEETESVLITGSDVNHIKNVLRMKLGEEISVSNGEDGKAYVCAISEITEDVIHCKLLSVNEDGNELPVKVTLFQGLPKSDKMEMIIQKAVELGVYEIVPVATKRCVVKLDEKKAVSRVARWQAIAEAAAKQSKRDIIPTISNVMPFAKALEKAADMELKLIPYELASGMEHTRELLATLKPGQQVAVFIGPEGGFEESEIALAAQKNVQEVTLGKRILRTETAGMTMLAWIGFLMEQ